MEEARTVVAVAAGPAPKGDASGVIIAGGWKACSGFCASGRPGGTVPACGAREVSEAKQGKLSQVCALCRRDQPPWGAADTDNWEDASVLIAVSRNWVEPKTTTHPLLAER